VTTVDPQNPTPEVLLWAYSQGLFPMADPYRRGKPIEWYCPDPRGILPLDGFHIPVNLARLVRQNRFEIRSDTAFKEVFELCAVPRSRTNQSWMNDRLRAAYLSLFEIGHAHSIEAWREGELVGGL
jgi:leucyl/phenylalanyl-tRNA---protein transferase